MLSVGCASSLLKVDLVACAIETRQHQPASCFLFVRLASFVRILQRAALCAEHAVSTAGCDAVAKVLMWTWGGALGVPEWCGQMIFGREGRRALNTHTGARRAARCGGRRRPAGTHGSATDVLPRIAD